MKNFRCDKCEAKYPRRQENLFASRKLIREHLRKIHDVRHAKKGIVKDRHCGCLAKDYTGIEVSK